MSRHISDETKLRQGRGKGTGLDYLPWIFGREFNSRGTASSVPDWKHGRMIQCLSQAERWFYYRLRWNDRGVDIREQFPLLPLSETAEIAAMFGTKGSFNNRMVMTTDFLVTMDDGSEIALTVKAGKDDVTPRVNELLNIEREYWRRRGVKYFIGFKEDLNPTEIMNTRDVVACYSFENVYDDISLVRHLIANKKLIIDMTNPIDYQDLIEIIQKDETWKTLKSKSECYWQ